MNVNSRVVLYALLGVFVDLLCVLGVAAVLLTHNSWLLSIGYSRFLFVVFIVAIGVVPMMYGRERLALARQWGDKPDVHRSRLPAWAGVDRSSREPAAA